MPSAVTKQPGGVVITVKVTPRASSNEVVSLDAEAVRVRITAAPVDGKANIALIRYLASSLGVPKSAVEVVSGHSGRTKRVVIASDRSTASITDQLQGLAAEGGSK